MTFQRLAVTPEQIATYGLSRRLPPQSTDKRGGEWGGGVTQAEALAPPRLARGKSPASNGTDHRC